jgi:hypothetical protein
MSEKIQKIPGGLLDQLGIKAGGRNPSDLSDEVRPQLDLSLHYLVNRLEAITVSEASTGVVAGDSLAEILVPQGEAWWLKAIGYKITGFSLTTSFMAKSFLRPGGTGTALRYGEIQSTFTHNSGREISYGRPIDLIVPPGSQVGIVFESNVSGNFTGFSTVIAARLSV